MVRKHKKALRAALFISFGLVERNIEDMKQSVQYLKNSIAKILSIWVKMYIRDESMLYRLGGIQMREGTYFVFCHWS